MVGSRQKGWPRWGQGAADNRILQPQSPFWGAKSDQKKKKKKSWSLKLYVLSELFVHELLERVLSRLMVEQLSSAVCAQRFATKASPAQHLQPTLFHTGTPSATAALLTTPSSVPVPPQDYRTTECQSG